MYDTLKTRTFRSRLVTNMVAKVRAFRLDNLKFFNFTIPPATPNNSTNMDDPVTPPMSARKPGEEIKTKHKEAMRQLYRFAKIGL